MKQFHTSHSAGFSIIELMVGIFIFTLGLLSVYMVLMTSVNANERNKNAIIASNLAREQIEIFRNIRDTNYKKLQLWNQQNPQQIFSGDTSLLFLTGSYYTLENDMGAVGQYAQIENITLGFEEGKEKLQGSSMQSYQLCLDSADRYRYCKNISGEQKKLPFYRYLFLQEVRDQDGDIIPSAFLLVSKVIWNSRGYHEFEMKTILTDWRRL